MFNTDLTEAEQIIIFRTWMRRYLPWILGTLALVIIGILANQLLKNNSEKRSLAESALYFELTKAVSVAQSIDIDTATTAFEKLKSTYPDSGYATLASLLYAKALMQQDNLQDAKSTLLAALTTTTDADILPIIAYRAALLQWQLDEQDDALGLLEQYRDTAYSSMYDELKGDIQFDAGDGGAAKTTWESIEPVSATDSQRIQAKIDNIVE